MRLSLAAFIAAAVAFAAPAFAEPTDPPITTPTKIIDNATAEVFAELIREIGGQNVEIKRDGEFTGVVFTDGGVPYNIGFALCKLRPGKCLVASMLVLVDNGKGGYPLETLNKANKDAGFLTFFKTDATKFGVGRLMLVDGGVTKKHLAYEIALFVQSYREMTKELEAQLIAGAPGPFQRASFGPTQLRPIVVSPRFIAQQTERLAQRYRGTIR